MVPNGKPVTDTKVEETLVLSRLGFARGANEVDLKGSLYRCKQFTPNAHTSVIARHQERGLIGQLVIAANGEASLPLITERPEDAVRVKLDRVDLADGNQFQLKMKPAAKLRGRVVDSEGNPRVVRIDGYRRPFRTDDDGRFELPLVLPEFPVTIRAVHGTQLQPLGVLVSNLILEPGEVRDLGDLQVKRGQ